MKSIKYQLMREVNHGTEEEPNIVQTFSDCEIRCSEETFESNYALALKEAVGGEVTVEDVEEPEAQPGLEQRVTVLEDSSTEMAEALELLLSGVTE